MNKNLRAPLGALLVSFAAVLWGFDGVFLTPRLFNLDVRFIVFVLHALPFLIFSAVLSDQFKLIKTLRFGDWTNFVLVAATGGVIGTLAIVKALMTIHFQPLSVVILIQKLQPVFAILLAAILLRERPGIVFWIPALLALAASYVMTFGLALPDIGRDTETIRAALYALTSAAAFGSATTLGKRALKTHKPETLLFFRYGLTTLIMVPLVLIPGILIPQVNAATPLNWIVFGVTAVTTGSGAIFIYYIGMRRITASMATLCELFFPVSTILFDLAFNGARLTPLQLAAAGVLTLCILFIGLTYKPPADHPAE